MKQIKNIDRFLKQSIKKYNNKFSYDLNSLKTCINFSDEFTCICPIHGRFVTTIDQHIRGIGCKECNQIQRLNTQKEKFIKKWTEKFPHLDYTAVEYINNTTDVNIRCSIHGMFSVKPCNFRGCSCCNNNTYYDRDTFILQSLKVHGNTYSYENVVYQSHYIPVIINCKIHGSFEQKPSIHVRGSGCQQCSKDRNRTSWDDLVTQLNKIHNNQYSYIYSDNYLSMITMVCKLHGEHTASTGNHKAGSKCPKCSNKYANLTTSEFIIHAKEIWKDYDYDYTNTVYSGIKKEVEIFCKTHGLFKVVAWRHLYGNQKCKHCTLNFSRKLQHQWIASLKNNNIIEEFYFRIPQNLIKSKYNFKTRIFVDGYDPSTNTVYEFHGDFWHGNPLIYDSNDIHPYRKVPYGQLYQETLTKELLIKDMGFNLIVMWESTWKSLDKSSIICYN